MTDEYRSQEIEPKWQKRWEEDGLYHAEIDRSKEKFYALTMLPYPSGDLHIGHWYAMTPSDARARYKRMQGKNVLFPMGFDAFGLPAENAAIKRNIHPKEWTYNNIKHMRKQLKSMGAMFDWEREAISCEPSYYRWTEWFFIQLYKHGLAYRQFAPVDWCPSCNTTLAREQVVGEERLCERCDTPVIKKELEQWFFRITDYAEELLDFSHIDWPKQVVAMQKNWIGRSEGASVIFHTEEGEPMEVFTTRPDTLWGATFMVLAPEHPLVDEVTTEEHRGEVEAYKKQAERQTQIERAAADKEKSGVFTGGYAINPVNGERIPVWTADYVMMGYGTGAIMGVPAHDERDFNFARRYDLEIIPVIQPEGEEFAGETMEEPYIGPGAMINSGPLSGTVITEDEGHANPGIMAVIEWLEEQGIGEKDVSYKIQDWLISRQRYWGTPIPMVHCQKCGWNPVPEDELPVLLPEDVEWLPTGESPLKLHPTWKKTICPACGGPAERETDTMDTFMCSSWYHLRYLSPGYEKAPFKKEEYDYWMPVDTYTGGVEHATMHLIYTRFFHKAFRDIGITKGPEPMLQLRNQGQILAPDRQRMSKSRGNVIPPDPLVEKYGADAVRCYLMFGYRWSEGGPWSEENIQGVVRWLNRVWDTFMNRAERGEDQECPEKVRRDLRRKVHVTLQQISEDYQEFEFNTVISALMELLNEMNDAIQEGAVGTAAWSEAEDYYLRMLAPSAPHIAEELWTEVLGKPYSIHEQPWPEVDEEATQKETFTLVVQVNGKLRDRVQAPVGISDEKAKELALESEGVAPYLEGNEVKKVIVVPGRLVNIVV